MKKLIINDFAFLGVIDKKGFLSDWVLIPTLYLINMKKEIKEVLSDN
ncbi:MAG: hypothetical protein ABIK97_06950 [candidate division WOR-3 bacterium]